MRTKVIGILADDTLLPKQKFNKLLGLMSQIPGVSPHQFRYLNQVGFSTNVFANMQYDIKKLLGIKDTEITSFQLEVHAEPVVSNVKHKAMSYAELKATAKDITDKIGIKPANQKKDTLEAFVKKHLHKEENPFEAASPEAKEGMKLRDIYPFLRDADCPDVLKILVADKITAFEEFVKAREELAKLEGTADFESMAKAAASAVENFELDILIHAELNYYSEHKEFLGNHPAFEDYNLQKKVNAYKAVELAKRQATLRANISRDTKKLDAMKAGEKKDAFEAKLILWNKELKLIDGRLKNV